MKNNIELINSIQHRPPMDGIDHMWAVECDSVTYRILNPHWIANLRSREDEGIDAFIEWCLNNIKDQFGLTYDHGSVDRETWTFTLTQF